MDEPPKTPVRYVPDDVDFRTPMPHAGATFCAYDYCLRTPEPVSGARGGGWGEVLGDEGPRTPRRASCLASPKKSPTCEYSDRLIPSRAATDLDTGLSILGAENDQPRCNGVAGTPYRADDENSFTYDRLLRGELLGMSPGGSSSSGAHAAGISSTCMSSSFSRDAAPKTPERPRGLFRYRCSPDAADDEALVPLKLRSPASDFVEAGLRSQRKIAKEPFRVLYAPNLQDDFYMNCLSNSPSDVLAVCLVGSVDLWSSRTERCTRLMEVGPRCGCSCVSWSPDGVHLAVGFMSGEVQLWDAAARRKVRSLSGHARRVGVLAWSCGGVLASGSRDHDILLRDMRMPEVTYARRQGHNQEVCGLSWSHDGQMLASGGNEGYVCVWSAKSSASTPLHRFSENEAAVKALAWSPHQRGLLASGGGTADKCVRFWNIATGTLLSCLPTGSQVCNLAWSKSVDELVTTHGYSGNEIIIWRYPNLSRVATLRGHTARPLYLAMSADGQVIITGAGDETLRFWNAFPSEPVRPGSGLRAWPTALARTIR